MSESDLQPVDPPPAPIRAKRRLWRLGIYLGFLLVLAEGGARLFWFARGVPFFGTTHQLYRSFYPELAALDRDHAARALDVGTSTWNSLNVLLLGGSALHIRYGDVEHVLRERLARTTGRRVHVDNLAQPGHTTLDSLYKYRHLAGRRFDLVVVYHGINEVRANNCPAETYRDDYGHFSWYRLINAAERGAQSRWFALGYTLRFIAVKTGDRLGWTDSLPTHRPGATAAAFGCDVKTAGAFRHNLEEIVAIAAERGDPLVLMTFAYHLPANYSEERFDRSELDFTAYLFPVELWGRPDCVAAALDAHSGVVRDLARANPGVRFVDQAALIPKDGLYFNDICHLTHEGCERWVQNLLSVTEGGGETP